MSKEETQGAQRAKEREVENAIYTASVHPAPTRTPSTSSCARIWWALLITARWCSSALSWAGLAGGRRHRRRGPLDRGHRPGLRVHHRRADHGLHGGAQAAQRAIRDKVKAMTRKRPSTASSRTSYLERIGRGGCQEGHARRPSKAGKPTSEQEAAAEAARAEVLSATKAKRRAEDAAEAASKVAKGAKGVKGKAAKAGKGAQGGGTTKVSVVSEDGSAPAGEETPASGAVDDAAADEAAGGGPQGGGPQNRPRVRRVQGAHVRPGLQGAAGRPHRAAIGCGIRCDARRRGAIAHPAVSCFGGAGKGRAQSCARTTAKMRRKRVN